MLAGWQVKHGVCFAVQQTERGLRRHRYDTVAEGIGLDRLTANFNMADVDEAVRVSDQEAVHMAHYLLHQEGMCCRREGDHPVAPSVESHADVSVWCGLCGRAVRGQLFGHEPGGRRGDRPEAGPGPHGGDGAV